MTSESYTPEFRKVIIKTLIFFIVLVLCYYLIFTIFGTRTTTDSGIHNIKDFEKIMQP